MFLSDPDAIASTLTQRDVLRLVIFHAYLSLAADPIETAEHAIELSALILDAEELEAQPAPADDVVGALADAARPASRAGGTRWMNCPCPLGGWRRGPAPMWRWPVRPCCRA